MFGAKGKATGAVLLSLVMLGFVLWVALLCYFLSGRTWRTDGANHETSLST